MSSEVEFLDSAAEVADDELNQEYLAELMYIVKDTVSYKDPSMKASIEQEIVQHIQETSRETASGVSEILFSSNETSFGIPIKSDCFLVLKAANCSCGYNFVSSANFSNPECLVAAM